MRYALVLGAYLLAGADACVAKEAIHYPIPIPDGCFALAEREHYSTTIGSRWEGIKARARLARMKDSDPLVHQCKQAVAQAIAAFKAAK